MSEQKPREKLIVDGIETTGGAELPGGAAAADEAPLTPEKFLEEATALHRRAMAAGFDPDVLWRRFVATIKAAHALGRAEGLLIGTVNGMTAGLAENEAAKAQPTPAPGYTKESR